MQRAQIAFPPFTGITKKIVLTLLTIFVVQLVAEVWLDIPVTTLLALDPTTISIATMWQAFTHVIVHPPEAIFQLALNLLMIWWFVAPIEQNYGRSGIWKLCILSTLFASVPALLFGISTANLGLFSYAYIAGAEPIVLASLAVFAFTYRQSHIYLFGLFAIRAIHIIYFSVAFAALMFLASRNLVALVAHLGAITSGWFFVKKPLFPKRRKPKQSKKKSGYRGALQVLQGGRSHDDDQKWLN